MEPPDPQDSAQPSNPAERAIAAFGGARRLAEAIKRDYATVYKWKYPPERGGTGGVIPMKAIHAILREAKARKLPLTAADLISIDLGEAA